MPRCNLIAQSTGVQWYLSAAEIVHAVRLSQTPPTHPLPARGCRGPGELMTTRGIRPSTRERSTGLRPPRVRSLRSVRGRPPGSRLELCVSSAPPASVTRARPVHPLQVSGAGTREGTSKGRAPESHQSYDDHTPMEKQTNPTTAKEPSFQQQLRARCTEWWQQYEASRAASDLVAFDWPQALYEFVKEATLISFKNGVTVGKRSAGRLDATRESAKVKQ